MRLWRGPERLALHAANAGQQGKDSGAALGRDRQAVLQSPKHKNFFVSDPEWLVITPLLYASSACSTAPVGVALEAYANDVVEERLSGNARLASYGGHNAMITDLKEKVFPGREVKFLGLEDGKVVVKGI